MELGLNPDRREDLPAVPNAAAQGQASADANGTPAEIAIGRFVLQVGEPAGAALREARRSERAHFRPHPSPIMLLPRLIRGLIDRRTETDAALAALDSGLPVEVSGPPGVGKTALLRHLAHHPRVDSFVDGVIYLSARHQTSLDLLQRVFEAFYESDTVCKPTDAEIRRALQDKHALVLIDDVALPQKEVEQVLDAAPRSAFVIATRERCLWGEVRSIALTGLAAEDGAALLERELERPLDAAEQSAAAALSATVEGVPRRVLQAAALIRKNAIPAAEWSNYITLEGPVAELMTSIDDRDRRVLLSLSALPGVGLAARDVSGIAEVPDVEASLSGLVGGGLVLNGQSRYRLADGVADRLRRTEVLAPWVNRAITYFTAWAERQRRNRDTMLEASDALLRTQQHATDTRRWGEALRLGRLLADTLVVKARWGAWEIALERSLVAAKALGDRAVAAWVIHEMGTRAVCLGDEGNARRLLTQAATLRESLGEHAAAALSRRNLGFIPAAVAAAADVPDIAGVADESHAPEAPAARHPMEFDSVPFRSEVAPSIHRRRSSGTGALVAVFMVFAALGGVAYQAAFGGFSFPTASSGLTTSSAPPVPQSQTAHAAVAPPPLRDMTDVVIRPAQTAPDAQVADAQRPPDAQRANILIFTARPGSIATSRPTNLCYAVSDAAQARIDPGVGDVDPANTLTCRRVMPARTTTYELSATGRDGVPVTQHVVIVVR